MADRIRAFQDIQASETAVPKPNSKPRVLTQANDSGIWSGRGRRPEASFASPAGRAARDGNEGLRGDGRPPVASVPFRKPPAIAQNDEQKKDPGSLPIRPVTSLEPPANEQALSQRPHEQVDLPSLHRRYRSMENVGDPSREIALARSRLRAVVDKIEEMEGPNRERADTLAELGHMLDDAIEDQSLMPGGISAELSEEFTPRPDLTSPSEPSQISRHQSHSRGSKPRRSAESALPRSSEESARINYTEQPGPHVSPHVKAHEDKPDAETLLVEIRPSIPHERQSFRTLLEPRRQPLPCPDQKLSPVKQRAAMFESLGRQPSQHEQACQHLPPGRKSPQDERISGKNTRKVARIKFGDTIEERPATPLIPLTLPTMVSIHQKSSSSSSAMSKEPAPDQPVAVDDKARDDVLHHRKSSMAWPFKWSIFNRSPSAATQDVELAQGGDEAEVERPPSSRPGSVKSIVQDLLQAANEKDDTEKRRRHSEKERLSRRQSRAPPLVRETELKEDEVDLGCLRPANVPPLQLSIKEEAEGLVPGTKAHDALSEPKTPLQRAMTEKQVLSPPDKLEALNESSPSPRKSDPQTPARGRSGKSTHRLSVGEHRGVEQRFNLSPGSSRSRSRNGRPGLKVEVEVRDSPEREAREKGEKIVIIRANVEPVDREE